MLKARVLKKYQNLFSLMRVPVGTLARALGLFALLAALLGFNISCRLDDNTMRGSFGDLPSTVIDPDRQWLNSLITSLEFMAFT